MGVNQDRDIAEIQRPTIVEFGFSRLRELREPDHLLGEEFRDISFGEVVVPAFDNPEMEVLFVVGGAAIDYELRFFRAGRDAVVCDSRLRLRGGENECVVFGGGVGKVPPKREDRVQRGDQIGFGAEVVKECQVFMRFAFRREVAEDVRAAERVDRLFGIANHEKSMTVGFAEDHSEYLVLDMVGVLELVHQG